MFQEEKNLSKKGLDSSKIDIAGTIGEAAQIKDSQKIASQIKTVSDTAQSFMNKPLQQNAPTVVENKVWAKQPTSNIFNAAAIPENAIAGINRVVKLEIFVEGKQIKFFKHFKLVQSAV